MTGNEIRSKLRAGERVYATCVVAASPLWPKTLAGAGIDFVFIDSEHTPVDRETLAWTCRGYASAGVPPVVRVPSPDPYEAAKVLDGGACGFIAPYVETAEQARRITEVARYRPLKGDRVERAVADETSLEPELRDYLAARNADTILIANIESVPAINNLKEILTAGDLDSVLIGPHDLSCSLGIPEQYDHPRFDEAVREIFTVAREHNVGAGIHYWLDIEMEVEWARAGANLIMHSSDLAIVGQNLKSDLAQLRSELGDVLDDGRDTEADII
ncbi:MAG: aldolase/citrate lyase family protein [Fuerstiella sp.]|nr:aldolase/citrate lyase family protein [Fuerstiella sp.]